METKLSCNGTMRFKQAKMFQEPRRIHPEKFRLENLLPAPLFFQQEPEPCVWNRRIVSNNHRSPPILHTRVWIHHRGPIPSLYRRKSHSWEYADFVHSMTRPVVPKQGSVKPKIKLDPTKCTTWTSKESFKHFVNIFQIYRMGIQESEAALHLFHCLDKELSEDLLRVFNNTAIC